MASETVKAESADFNVFKSLVITEKASQQGSTVVLRVDPGATKPQIKQAVERVFSVRVRAVRTCRYLGKVKRMGRTLGRRDHWKKAYVYLEDGQTLNLVEGL